MNTTTSSEKHDTDMKGERIRWKEYLQGALSTIIVGLLLIGLLFLIYWLSSSEDLNSLTMLELSILDNALLITASSALFLGVLTWFSKNIILDEKESFGIKDMRSKKAVAIVCYIIVFVSALYFLLDVSFQDVYMQLGPVLVVAHVQRLLNIELFPSTVTASEFYVQVRNTSFILLFVFLLLLSVISLLTFLTREGRSVLFKKREISREDSILMRNLLLFMLLPIGILYLYYLVYLPSLQATTTTTISYFRGGLLGIIIILTTIWMLMLVYFTIKISRVVALLLHANTLMIIPIIFTFYMFPVLAWAAWDWYQLSLSNTTMPGITELLNLIVFNLIALDRILQLDFVIVVGIAAVVIGVAEGYSLVAIVKAIKQGVLVKKTGTLITKRPPQIIILFQQAIFVFTWLLLLWDKAWWNLKLLIDELHIGLPLPNVPRFFTVFIDYLQSFSVNVPEIVFPLFLLTIPLYFMIMAAFKFFSVAIATERINDDHVHLILISSAFVLIITQILADLQEIAQNSDFIDSTRVPLTSLQELGILPWIMKIISYIEAASFYLGLAFVIYALFNWLKTKPNKKPINS